MALNVCNWSDKQLDELVDMLKSADFSSVAEFISTNFLCDSNGTIGPRILTDDTDSNMRATIGVDAKTIVISAGVFVHAGKCSQIDTNETVNILATTTGSWGTGLVADGAQPRWDIICVKNNEQAHAVATRWFVNDSTVPNTYYTQDANTLINKAYFDIAVVHGTPGAGVPDAPFGYWTIAEIYVPPVLTALLPANVYDTTDTSNKTPANWTSGSRILRMEFWATKFNVDHDPATGYHRDGSSGLGGWHIGSTLVTVSATELNTALDGINVSTVTAAHLTKLTDTSTLAPGELHSHGGAINMLASAVRVLSNTTAVFDWTDLDLSAYLPANATFAYVTLELQTVSASSMVAVVQSTALVRPKGSVETVYLPRVNGFSTMFGFAGSWAGDLDTNTCFAQLGPGRIIQVKWFITSPPPYTAGLQFGGSYSSHLYIDLLGYI